MEFLRDLFPPPPRPRPPRVIISYFPARDVTVVGFPDRLGGWTYLRDENGGLASVARGQAGSERREQIARRFTHIDTVFRSME